MTMTRPVAAGTRLLAAGLAISATISMVGTMASGCPTKTPRLSRPPLLQPRRQLSRPFPVPRYRSWSAGELVGQVARCVVVRCGSWKHDAAGSSPPGLLFAVDLSCLDLCWRLARGEALEHVLDLLGDRVGPEKGKGHGYLFLELIF